MSIQKVAELAGVSTSTVSRVINQHPRVAPETIDAVKAAMTQLAYRPSARRPGPKPQQRIAAAVRTIGFLVIGRRDDAATPGFFDLLRGISTAFSDCDRKFQVHYLPDASSMPTNLSGDQLDGAILHGIEPREELRKWLKQVPCVWVMGNRSRPTWGDQIMPDSLEIGEIAAAFHAEAGLRETLFINLDSEHWGLSAYGLGYQAAAKRRGLRVSVLEMPHATDEPSAPDYSPEEVAKLLDAYVRLETPPEGVFIADALQSATLLPQLKQHGFVGSTISQRVITCNNEPAYFTGMPHRPAIIDVGIEAIGRHSVHQLLWRMEHGSAGTRVTTMVAPRVI